MIRSLMKSPAMFMAVLLAMVVSCPAFASGNQPQVGVLAASTGIVQLRGHDAESAQIIVPGAPIYLYDEVITGDDTRAQILMRDETTFSVGANTSLIIDEFIFDPSDHVSGLIKANVTKGVFRFISGRIAKANPVNMKVKAGNAVIAVRGTEVIGTITAEASTIVLLSGRIDMTSVSDICQSGGAGCSQSLTRAGFGVELTAAGQFSAPTRFEPDEINRVIGTLQVNDQPKDREDDEGSSTDTPQNDNAEETAANDEESGEKLENASVDNNDDKPVDEKPEDQAQENIVSLEQNTGDTSDDEAASANTNIPTTRLRVTRSDGQGEITIVGADDDQDGQEISSIDINASDLKPEDTVIEANQNAEIVLASTLPQNTLSETSTLSSRGEDRLDERTKRAQKLSDFDLIVMRALGVIEDPNAPATETMTMDLPQDISVQRSDEEQMIDEDQDERELTEEVYEEEVEDAVNKLQKGQEEETSGSNGTQTSNENNRTPNSAPTLSLGRLGSTDDTSADDTFTAVTASATASDADSGDTLTFGLNGATQSSNLAGYSILQVGSYGRLHLNTSTGAYSYVPDDEATEELTSTVTDSFQITVTDGTDTARQSLSATLRGVNDTPVLAVITGSTLTDTAADDTFAEAAASLDGSDRDQGQTLTYGITSGSANTSRSGYTHALNGSYGTLYLNSSSGDYVYVPDDSTIEGLKTSVTDTFAMTVSDGTAGQRQDYRVTINGVNDTPSLNAVSGMSFTDTAAADSFSNQSGTLSGSDRDRNETLTYGIDGGSNSGLSGYDDAYVGTYGTLHVNASSGAYVYVPNVSAIEGVKTSQTDQFTLTVSDGSLSASQTLTTSISGANDTPILGQISAASFTDTSGDDSFSNVSATAGATDADTGDTMTYSITGGNADTSRSGFTHSASGSYGTLYINSSSGAYIYVINDGAMEGASSTVTDSFTVSASDGSASSTSDFVATINGVNDTPVLTSISGITVTDTNANDSFTNTSASLSGSDRDTGASLTYSIDGGSADTSVSGFTHSRSGTYGTLYIAASSGDYRFIPNDSAVEGLTSTVTEDFTLELSDGTASVTQTLTTTLQGVNDTPTLASLTGISLVDTASDDTFTNTSGTASGADRDSGDTVAFALPNGGSDTSLSGYTQSEAGSFGTLYLNETSGAYTYMVNDRAVEARKTDASDQFSVQVSDGSLTATQTLTASVTGANDTPTIGSLSGFSITDTVEQDSFSAQSGAASGNDVDTGDTVVFGISGGNADTSVSGYTHSLTGTYGRLMINSSSGAYQFLPDSDAVDGAIATVTESFTITASDGSATATTNLVATINGVDDRPILISPDSITVQDTAAANSFSTINDTVSGSNAESSQTTSFAITGGSADTSVSGFTHSRTGTYGRLYINSSSGAYRYIPTTSAIEALTSSQNENFELTFTDGVTSVRGRLATVLAGVNDTPIVSAFTDMTFTDTADDDTFTAQSGSTSATDADTGTSFSYGAQNMQSVSGEANFTHIISGNYGDLYFNNNSGAYEYRPNDTAIEALSASATDTFSIQASDGTVSSNAQTLTVNVNGVDDKPVISVGNGSLTLNTGSAGQQTATASDVEGHTITDISSTVAALPGWLNFTSNNNGGAITYYWEVTSDTPTWLNGTRNISFKARANGLDSDTQTATFTFQCQSDLCSQFVQSTDATNPVSVIDATNVNELASKDELGIAESTFTLMNSSQMSNLFDINGNDSGSFRVVYTANEGGGASNPGTWQVDQRVAVDYSKRDITVNNTYQFTNIEYFGGESGSFSFNNMIDTTNSGTVYAGKDAMFYQGQAVDTGVDINGQNVLITATDHIAFLNDGSSTDAATIWTTLNPHSGNPANYNDTNHTLSVEEWRVLEPQ